MCHRRDPAALPAEGSSRALAPQPGPLAPLPGGVSFPQRSRTALGTPLPPPHPGDQDHRQPCRQPPSWAGRRRARDSRKLNLEVPARGGEPCFCKTPGASAQDGLQDSHLSVGHSVCEAPWPGPAGGRHQAVARSKCSHRESPRESFAYYSLGLRFQSLLTNTV